jgi:lysylphosphatidylglycerol synthetase-like protein (DUF2156 family)
VDTSFQERYAGLSDEELLHIAGNRRELLEQAAVAVDAEMARRGLTFEQARAKKREHRRREFEEMSTHIAKRNKSKYFVAHINLPVFFAGLAGEVLLMVLLPSGHRVQDEWMRPLIVVYLGALLAILSVQSWVRRTLSFWISLVVSFVPQFFVARWLAVYHPDHSRSGEKGSAMLSLLAGYAVAVPLFLLLQKLKPSQGAQAAE